MDQILRRAEKKTKRAFEVIEILNLLERWSRCGSPSLLVWSINVDKRFAFLDGGSAYILREAFILTSNKGRERFAWVVSQHALQTAGSHERA